MKRRYQEKLNKEKTAKMSIPELIDAHRLYCYAFCRKQGNAVRLRNDIQYIEEELYFRFGIEKM